jgi:hypothetical protein
MSAETLTHPQAEQEAKYEHLTKEEVDKAFADIAFILALESLDDDDPIWEKLAALQETMDAKDANKQSNPEVVKLNSASEIFDLLNTLTEEHADGFARHSNKRVRFTLPYANPRVAFGPSDRPIINLDYTHPSAEPGAQTSAPSVGDTPLGPELPNLAFNDRVHAQGARPSTEQFAAADRANEMYKRELLKQGWNGGEATAEQAKKAGRAMQFQYHPDRGASPEDADALKAFNSQNAKPTTPGQKDS